MDLFPQSWAIFGSCQTDVGPSQRDTRHRWTCKPFAVICRLCMNLGVNFSCFFFRSWKLGSFRVSSFAGLGSLKRERCCYGCVDNSNSETFKYFNKLQNIYCAGERSAVCCSHNILLNVKFIFWIIIDLHWLLVHRVVFEFVLLDHFFHSLFGWTKWQLIEDDSCTILFTWYPCQPWGTYIYDCIYRCHFSCLVN